MKSRFFAISLASPILLVGSPIHGGQMQVTGPAGSERFGSLVTVLPNGNIVVTDSGYSASETLVNVGAVYLYDGTTLEVICMITGSAYGDRVGSAGITVLPNSNFLIASGSWGGGRGAVTWVNGAEGVTGQVSQSNSLVGDSVNSPVGGVITKLSNGNYVVGSPLWNHRRGAATWGDGSKGVAGLVSSSNSLVGDMYDDSAGNEITALPNGNYAVISRRWNGNRGAVTWGSGTGGVKGLISSSNSLIGDTADNYLGQTIQMLSNSNFLVVNKNWNGNRGSVTWINGTAGTSGVVGPSNSLVGSSPGDLVGDVILLANGNYLVQSEFWNGNRGALTWGNAVMGGAGFVGAANSLIGSRSEDRAGKVVAVLPNGNYVAASRNWNENRGAATWGSGVAGVKGEITSMNSLVGSASGDYAGLLVVVLSNGNYVVQSHGWNSNRGAATWGHGEAGVKGVVSLSNSLVGSNQGDNVGFPYALPNGNYVVLSPEWNEQRGAVTLADGTIGLSGQITSSNSLVGESAYQAVGSNGVTVLTTGNYVVLSPRWNLFRGAATWGSSITGVKGLISPDNSLVGSVPFDMVGQRAYALSNGNYVVNSGYWSEGRGAVTWGNGVTGVSGHISSSNSLVGSSTSDAVGIAIVNGETIGLLTNGNYIVHSPLWNESRGAVTWGDGNTGVAGTISSSNSLVGSTAGDGVGSHQSLELLNGNFIVRSPGWNSWRGAATWGNGMLGIAGAVSASNSLVGSTADDGVGGEISLLPDGGYALHCSGWDNGSIFNAGAVSLRHGLNDANGYFTEANDFLGTTAVGGQTMTFLHDAANSRYVVGYPVENRFNLLGLVPEMAVSGNTVSIANGETVPHTENHTDFGTALLGIGNVVRTFSIANSGMEPLVLSGSPRVFVSGTHAADFIVSVQPDTQVNPVSATSFQVVFTPGGPGIRSATLAIANNDSDESLYRFAVQGIGQTVIGSWRSAFFGGAAVDVGMLEDFDSDGIHNLFEFAFGTLPNNKSSGVPPLQYTGTFAGGGILAATGQPVTRFAKLPEGDEFRILFVRRKDYAAAGLTYTPQFSADLAFWEVSTAEPMVLADDGIHQIVSVPYPSFVRGGGSGFFKITVTLE